MVVAADPSSGRLDVLGVLQRPYVIPAAMADTRRGLFYALPCDRSWQGQGFAVFDLRQGRTIYHGHVETEASRRFVFVDEAGGGAWFSVRPEPGAPQVWLARYDAASNTVEERALPLPEGYGPVRAGTERRDGRGLFYGVCDGLLVRIDPDGRRSEPLGPVWPTEGGMPRQDPASGRLHDGPRDQSGGPLPVRRALGPRPGLEPRSPGGAVRPEDDASARSWPSSAPSSRAASATAWAAPTAWSWAPAESGCSSASTGSC